MALKKFEQFQSLLNVVRWSTEKIKASDLKPQHMTWGGFEATALSFTPYDSLDDPRINYWKKEIQKFHGKEIFPNYYVFDLSRFPYKNEKELTEIGFQAYRSIEIENELRDLKINLTLDRSLGIVEFRIYEGCSIKITDKK